MSTFYLGTHASQWLGWEAFRDVPLFVSHNRLKVRKALPRAVTDWALDSGGFTEISQWGTWRTTPEAYVAEVRRYMQQIGRLQWAAIQDWMCEPHMLQKTGLTVEEHQRRTCESYATLLRLAPEVPWAPVLQGWTREDYLRHVAMYAQAGLDLRAAPVVGVGSVCRRQHTGMVEELLRELHGQGLKLHGFGFKVRGLPGLQDVLASSDSMAWSLNARSNPRIEGHTHKSCGNCPEWALRWRAALLGRVTRSTPQLSLFTPRAA